MLFILIYSAYKIRVDYLVVHFLIIQNIKKGGTDEVTNINRFI